MSTSIALLRVVAGAARDAGVPAGDLLARARIDEAELSRPDGRVPTPVYLELFDEAARASGRDDFGVLCARRLDAEAFGLIGFVLGSAPTLGEAFERLARFSRLLSDELSIAVETSARQVTIRYAMQGTPYVPALFEMAFVHCVGTARRGAGETFRAEEVTFAHAVNGAHLGEALLGARVTRGRHNEVRCPRAVVALPLLGANRTLLGILEHQANVILERLPASDDFLAAVRAAILRELALGEPTLAVVAERLRVGARTFQRRLATHGITYQALLDHVRRDEALSRLQTPDVSVASVALALGYRDASAFHHAFRRWTGQSPRQVRARPRRG